MFYEASEHPLDKKFRVFVPKRIQDQLERDEDGNLVVMVTRGEDGCLFLFGESGYYGSLGNLDTRAFTTREQRLKQRRMTKDTARVVLDASGRLLLGPKQRKLIELEENEEGKTIVVLAGVMNRVEIWPLRKWREMEALLDEDGEEMVEYDERGAGGA